MEYMTIVDNIISWYTAHMGYGSIMTLMAVESSFIPFPSEVVIPPAAFVATEQGSALAVSGSYPIDVLLIILAGTIGALIGAYINYGLSVWLGRPIIYKLADSKVGHLLLLSGEKVLKAEAYFAEHGKVSTFIGRLIPGIRQLISIPAGLSRMHFGQFTLYTFLGAFIWNSVLAGIGYLANGQMELIKEYSHVLSVAILLIVALVVVFFIGRVIYRRVRKQ